MRKVEASSGLRPESPGGTPRRDQGRGSTCGSFDSSFSLSDVPTNHLERLTAALPGRRRVKGVGGHRYVHLEVAYRTNGWSREQGNGGPMGVTTHDIFGEAERPQPATPGSYGEPPSGFRLPQATRLGPVHLRVADLGRSVAYYETTLGLRVLDRGASGAVLSTQGQDFPLVVLREHHGAHPSPRRGHLGLYHFAILLPDRPALGRFVRHLGELDVRAGAGDHLVSESFYLQDPDNLGIEVYADRPQARWKRIGRQLMMATDPVDVEGVIEAAGATPWSGMPPGTVMGHVHLHVGDLSTASTFFSDTLGFDRMVWQYPGALFLAAGGYHHHLGTNIWAGPAARPPDENMAQLLEWTLVLPDRAGLEGAAESLARAGHPVERDAGGAGEESLRIKDPWGTPIRLRLEASVEP